MNYINDALDSMKKYFNTDITKTVFFRQQQLGKLRDAIKKYEREITEALKRDLNKAPQESYMTEIGIVLSEIKHTIRSLPLWSKGKHGLMPLAQFYSTGAVYPEPYGVVLIISPWNYPFQLTMAPLIGAIAAGNCCIIKPSEFSPHTSAVMEKLLTEIFDSRYVKVIQGDAKVSGELLEKEFDYIFFTGSPKVGRIVMKAAAQHLTPVTLELGGKSPCIVQKGANISMAAKRIAFGKFLNAGQTCVAPDYILVERTIKDKFLAHLKKEINDFFGSDPLKNDDYPKIITDSHYERLKELIKGEEIFCGGRSSAANRKIEPTVLDNVSWSSPVMAEEIFGPILPIIAFDHMEDALFEIKRRPKPLALYVFTKDNFWEKEIIRTVSFGGGCINDTIIHLTSSKFPFGGVGASGIGSYHGKYSFNTFSHKKTVVRKRRYPDINLRYHPYSAGKLWWIKRFMK
ncbi:MAG: aldehyde dehydrogenase [Bacillota bacterium]|nr:aldehyde dehydrogenase [Bacillota bacterium]